MTTAAASTQPAGAGPSPVACTRTPSAPRLAAPSTSAVAAVAATGTPATGGSSALPSGASTLTVQPLTSAAAASDIAVHCTRSASLSAVDAGSAGARAAVKPA